MARFANRRDSASQWAAVNPVLAAGELGVELNAGVPNKFKIGNGSTAWNGLPYYLDADGVQALIGPGGVGEDGLSAYEIAVQNGFVGTAIEWLASLQGEDGLQGEQGPQGPAGPEGPSGAVAPFRFYPEDYGALGNGKLVNDVSITNGSGVLNSTASGFVGAAVGQWVLVNTNQGGIIGQITSVANAPGQITISTACSSTETDINAVFGTDDTTAINAAVTAGKAYAEAHQYYYEIQFQDKIYIVAGLTQSNDGTAIYNTQIKIPQPTNNNRQKLVSAFKGVSRVDHLAYWNAKCPSLAGTSIVSMKSGVGEKNATYGWQSVFGTPTPAAGMAGDAGAGLPTFVNTKPVFENIQVVLPVASGMCYFDFSYAGGYFVDGCSAIAFANAFAGNGYLLKDNYNTFGVRPDCGIRGSEFGNNADVTINHFSAQGLCAGISVSGEHVTIGSLKFIYMGVCIQVINTNQGHGITIDRVTAEAYQGGLQYKTGGSNRCPIKIGMWNTEVDPIAYDIYDPGGSFYGEFTFANTVESRNPIVNGAPNLKVTTLYRGPGNWASPPSVPASGANQQNTAWRDAAISLIGGTVTDVKVAGVTVAAGSNTTVLVPSGKNIQLTYSSAPTWVWTLL